MFLETLLLMIAIILVEYSFVANNHAIDNNTMQLLISLQEEIRVIRGERDAIWRTLIASNICLGVVILANVSGSLALVFYMTMGVRKKPKDVEVPQAPKKSKEREVNIFVLQGWASRSIQLR